MEIVSTRTLLLAAFGFLIYSLALVVYRLFFSPIAKFPGPKLAASTFWYEFYYDVIKKGRYTWKLTELHETYGPIIRINPYELHINDPDYYDTLYTGNSRRTAKWSWATQMFGRSTSGLATESHELHRIRRGALGEFFSKASVRRLEPAVQSVVDKLITRLQEFKGSGKDVNVCHMYTAFTADVVAQYAFAQPYGYLDDPEFAQDWHQLVRDASQNSHFLKQFGWVEPLMRGMPIWLVKIVMPQMMPLFSMQDQIHKSILHVKAELAKGSKPTGQTTIFYDILTNPNLRPQEKETTYIMDESQVVVAAGTVTTAHMLTILTFYLLANPHMLGRLQAELRTVMPDSETNPKWQQLEQLPYMNAVVTEAYRIGYGIIHRLQRISPDVALKFKEWTIPVNTPVSMSAAHLHDNPHLFPEPRTFNPDRWMLGKDERTRLGKYVVPFSRGTRACLGMSLASCEIYLALAAVFRPGEGGLGLRLHETDVSDVEIAHDFFNPVPRLDSKGVRVMHSAHTPLPPAHLRFLPPVPVPVPTISPPTSSPIISLALATPPPPPPHPASRVLRPTVSFLAPVLVLGSDGPG